MDADSLSAVSVVMSVWNGDKPDLLARSLSSIVAQSKPPAEIIIVIDGAIGENLVYEIQRFSTESGIKTIVQQSGSNMGLWHARNTGIALARHSVLALHDADDVMHPLRLEMQLHQLFDKQLDVLCSPSFEFSTHSSMILGIRDLPLRKRRGTMNLRLFNPINHSSVMIRKEAVVEAGGYRDLAGVEDLDLWRRLNWKGKRFGSTDVILQALCSDGELLLRRRITLAMFQVELLLMMQSIRSRGKKSMFVELVVFVVRLGYRVLPQLLMKGAQSVIFRKAQYDKSLTLQTFLLSGPMKVTQC